MLVGGEEGPVAAIAVVYGYGVERVGEVGANLEMKKRRRVIYVSVSFFFLAGNLFSGRSK